MGLMSAASPGSAVVKNLPASEEDARDMGSPPELGRSSGVGNGNPLQYSCLENSMDGETWWATADRVPKSQTQLSDFTFTFHLHAFSSVQFSSVQLLSHVRLFATP